MNEIAFSYKKMGTKTRFEEEAKGNSEMAYLRPSVIYSVPCDQHRSQNIAEQIQIRTHIKYPSQAEEGFTLKYLL